MVKIQEQKYVETRVLEYNFSIHATNRGIDMEKRMYEIESEVIWISAPYGVSGSKTMEGKIFDSPVDTHIFDLGEGLEREYNRLSGNMVSMWKRIHIKKEGEHGNSCKFFVKWMDEKFYHGVKTSMDLWLFEYNQEYKCVPIEKRPIILVTNAGMIQGSAKKTWNWFKRIEHKFRDVYILPLSTQYSVGQLKEFFSYYNEDGPERRYNNASKGAYFEEMIEFLSTPNKEGKYPMIKECKERYNLKSLGSLYYYVKRLSDGKMTVKEYLDYYAATKNEKG